MDKLSVQAIIAALNQHDVRYLIVGGLAVVMHGHVRFTADVDVVLSVETANLRNAINALKPLGYRPRAPVAFEEYLDPEKRRQWAIEKHMTVFSLFSPAHPATEIDLFLEPPVDFQTAFNRRTDYEIAAGVRATFCSLEDLVAMKTAAGRPQDLEDIRNLRSKNHG